MNNKKKATLDWLLESQDIDVRYLALRDLVHAGPKELDITCKKAMKKGQLLL